MKKSKRINYDGTIKKIYHIADVHIRNLKRFTSFLSTAELILSFCSRLNEQEHDKKAT